MKKRILSVLLAIVMVVGMFPVTAGATTAEPVKTWSIGASESGTDAVVAKLYTNVTDNTKYDLVISGTGEMGTTTGTKMPWRGSEYQQHIVSVTVESGVTNVNSYAFKDCTALTSVTIGDTVTEIGSFAFNGCTALTSVTLGATVTEIWGYAFGGCTSLTAYTVDSENTAYSATDGILFSKDGTTLVSYPSNKSGTSYTVPNSVTKISSSAFCDVTTLTELTIPHTTTSIVGTIFHGKAFEGKITIKGHTGSAAETYTKGDPDSTTFVSICSDGDDADTLCDVCGYDTAHAAHPICGATHSDIGDHTGTCEAVEWTAWDGGTITYTNDTASVYLSTNVTLESTLTVAANQTLHLCLNGHSITSSGENTITVSGGATLNICDCSTGETGGKIANTCSSNGRGIINSGIVNIYGGTIEATGHSGRGIYLNSGTVNVYGGSVSGDTYSIYNDGTGTVNIIGGSVGKDIYNYGDNSTVKVSGGSVEGGTYGIQNNKGTVDITGGTVSGEEGIYNPNGGRVVVTAGSVSGEYTGIYNSGTLTVSGGTVKSTGTDGNNYGIYNFYHGAGSLELSGAPTITGATAGVYLDGGSITLGGELTYVEEKAISVGMETPGTFTSGWNSNMSGKTPGNYFTSAMDGYTVQPDGSGELKLAEPPTYTVTYNGNGATSGDVPADSNSPYISGSTVTVLGNTGNLAKTGYAFVGWNTWSSGYGTDYAPGATFNINSNTTLYAQWEEYEITTQPTESTPAVGTNADGDIASYQWYKGTMSEVTDTADGVSAYTKDTLTSSYSDGWWTCHEAGGYSIPGYFTIVLNAGDSILAQTSDVINYAQLGIWAAYEKQDWDWTTPDDHFLVTAPADGNYDLHVSDVTDGGGTQPTVKAQVFHIGSTPADGATSKTLEADEDGWYACKITYADGTVLYSGPVEYEAPTISVTDVSLDKSSLTLDVGGTEQLTATVLPNNATDKTVTWHSDNGNIATVDSNGNITAQNVGTTTITATAGGKTATCTVTVNAKALSAFNVTLSQDSFTYDGSAKTPTVIVKDGDTVLTEGTDYTVSYSDNTNAGTGKVTVTFTGNYSGSAEKSFTISKATPTYPVPANLTATYGQTLANVSLPNGWSWVNDSQSVGAVGTKSFDATFTPSDTVNYKTVEVKLTVTVGKATPVVAAPTAQNSITYGAKLSTVGLTDGWTWANGNTVPTVNNSGYTAYYTPNDTANFDWTAIEGWNASAGRVERTVAVTVNKSAPTYTAPTGLTATYGDTLANVSLPSGWTWKTPSASVGNAGVNSFKAVYTPSDTDNFNAAEVDVSVTVNAKQLTNPTLTLDVSSFTYDGSAKTPVVTVKDGTTELTEGTDYTVSYSDNTDAGTGKVMVTFKGNYSGSAEKSFTISKATPTYLMPANLTATYGQTLANVSLPNGWSWVNDSQSVGAVGTKSFDATFTPSDTVNYKTVEVKLTVTVGKATPVVAAPTAQNSITYGAKLNTVGLTDGWTWVDGNTVPTVQNTGFKAYYTPGDTSNYDWTQVEGWNAENNRVERTVSVTVNKQKVTKPTENAETFTYNGTAQTYMETASTLYEISNETKTNAGSYTVIVALKDSANYEWTDGTTTALEYTFKIEQKELGIAWSNTTLTYNGAAQQPTATATGVVTGEQIALVLGAPATNAGSYTATVHSIDGATAQNYKLPTNKSTSFTIEQQALTILWGNGIFTYDSTEKFPAFNVEGIWNADDVQVTKEGAQTNAGEYTAQIIGLTGSDAGNYKLTGTLTKDFVINKADQAAPAVNKADETISGKNDGKITDVTANMEYRAEGEDHYTAITGETVENLADGKYYVRVKGDSNHNPSADTAVVIGAGRMLTVTVPQNQVGYTMITTTPEVEYFGSIRVEFKLHDGYSMTDSFQICNGTDPVGFSLMGDIYVYELNFVNSDCNFTVSGVADITAPLAQIDIKNNKWTSFWNGVTFGLFFNETQDVTVTAADTGSGMNSIQYYLAGGELELDEVKQITVWQDYSSTFQIDPDNAYVVYVKVTDNAGNVSYLNSDGVVLDQTVPVLVGIENNGSYYGDQCFKALDDYLDALKVDGVDVTDEMNADNEYTIVADNAEHIVTATDKAGNATEYKITVFKNYTVTYKVDGNTVSTQTVGHGKDATAPTIPEKEGYTQTAPVWDKDGTNITADTEINAVYTINKYTVTYKADGQVVDTQTIEHGANATPPTVPAKEGYTQVAPYWDKDGKNITVDTEINAVYTINKYTVTYMADGETISTQTIEHGADATAPAVPKKVGYTQVAPYWDKDGKNITTDTEINAVYTINKYNVTFNSNGGNKVDGIPDVIHDTVITAPTAPTKENATFAGWFSDSACTKAWNFDTDTVTADLTLYAKWSDVPVFHIRGKVVEEIDDGENDTRGVPNANVKLMLGTTLIATETTDENGLFYFGGQKAGDYNVVVTSGDKVITVLVALRDHDEDGLTVELPKTVTNSIVEHEPAADGKDSVAAGTLVGGLEDVAAAVRDENQRADKVEVKLTVKDTPPVTGTPTAGTEAAKQQAQQKAIQQKAGGKQLVFFDLSVVKTINDVTPVTITDTGDTLLEIRIPFDSGNKWGITIYRYHGDKAEVLAAVREGSTTEGFWVGDDGYIHIYTHKFSTYAVGYTVPSYGYFVPVTPDTVTSADTFDAGIVVYVTMSMLAATGSAVVIGKKRKEN